ncbi:hypothetical protein AIR33_00845 [Salmonella enterica]|nr:hypothetical protein [Salmonella enterica]
MYEVKKIKARMDNPRGLFLSVTHGHFVDIVKNNPLFFIHLKAFSCFAVVALMEAILPCF